MTAFMWLITALLGVFVATGLVLTIREAFILRASRLRRAPAEKPVSRYVGPIDLHDAPLTPPLRVGAEFLTALCGFPGLGWMISGRVRAGLPLFVAVPAIIWAFFPLYISMSGSVLTRPLLAFAPLPVLAVVSAGALAVCEFRGAHAR